jgi:hypothetical protein
MKRSILFLSLLSGMFVSLLPAAASAQTNPIWAVGVSYSIGSLVMYNMLRFHQNRNLGVQSHHANGLQL